MLNQIPDLGHWCVAGHHLLVTLMAVMSLTRLLLSVLFASMAG